MSRCEQWNGTQNHITNKIMNEDGIPFSKALIKTKKLINEFAKENNFTGSRSDKVMFVRNNYLKFIDSKLKNI
jgi:hypothetical protein